MQHPSDVDYHEYASLPFPAVTSTSIAARILNDPSSYGAHT